MERFIDLAGREGEPAVHALLEQAQIHRAPEDVVGRGAAIAAEYAESPGFSLWGLDHDGELLAVAGVALRDDLLWLFDLAVRVDRRRRGIGAKLIDSLRKQYPATAISGHTLEAASSFYEALGFEVTTEGEMPDGRSQLRFMWSPPSR